LRRSREAAIPATPLATVRAAVFNTGVLNLFSSSSSLLGFRVTDAPSTRLSRDLVSTNYDGAERGDAMGKAK